MSLRYYTVDVFTKHLFGGNPLAVFPFADGLKPETMQHIAREFNLSETAFVTKSDKGGKYFTVRIFTPSVELPFAGHPTLGTAYVLARLTSNEQPGAFQFREKVGDISIKLSWKNRNRVSCSFRVPTPPRCTSNVPSNSILAALLGISRDGIGDTVYQPMQASAGVPFCIVPICNEELFSSIEFNLSVWTEHLKNSDYGHIYPVLRKNKAGNKWSVRMFAPGLGVLEDPATGAAASAFAGYLKQYHPKPASLERIYIAQGKEMGRPSQIIAELNKTDDRDTDITISGSVVPVSAGRLYLKSNGMFS